MTVGKTDPNYAAALEAVRKAAAAVSGTDPVSGAPYAAGLRRPAGRTRSAAGAAGRRRRARKRGQPTCIESTLRRAWKSCRTRRRQADRTASYKITRRQQQARRRRRPARQRRQDASAAASTGSAAARRRWSAASTGSAAAPKRWKRASPKGPNEVGAAAERAAAGERPGARRQGADQAPGAPGRATPRRASSTPATSCSRRSTGRRRGRAKRPASTIDLRRRRPGGVDAGDLQVPLQHARLDRAQQAPRQATRARARRRTPACTTGVAGGAAQLNDYSQVTRDRIPFVIAAITLVTFLVLIAGPAGDPAGGDRGRAQPAHRRRRLRRS